MKQDGEDKPELAAHQLPGVRTRAASCLGVLVLWALTAASTDFPWVFTELCPSVAAFTLVLPGSESLCFVCVAHVSATVRCWHSP